MSIHLALFFTRGVSMRAWNDMGQTGRETALYAMLAAKGVATGFITYGGKDDASFAPVNPAFTVHPNRFGLPKRLYAASIPFLHHKALKSASIMKTNQCDGASAALNAARMFKKPLIVRMGYMWSTFAKEKFGEHAAQTRTALDVEKRTFHGADRIVVTTDAMRDDILARFPRLAERVRVIPNYVDVDRFAPDPTAEKRFDVVFLGRLSAQKNVHALFEAVRDQGLTMLAIGQGELGPDLDKEYGDMNGRFVRMDKAPHYDLPGLLRQGRVFALPSLYEGHPKALIEAMSLGLPVVATDAPGIAPIAVDGENALISGFDAASIGQTLVRLLADAKLASRLGAQARRCIVQRFSLDRIAALEWDLYNELL